MNNHYNGSKETTDVSAIVQKEDDYTNFQRVSDYFGHHPGDKYELKQMLKKFKENNFIN